jgi:cation:H+ antiporter
MSIALILLGALLLYVGGEALVRSSVQLARVLGVTPLVVGLTVVAFGTSTPELAATLVAAARGAPELALGNVIGSNSANLGFILGLAAAVSPIHAEARFIRREIPFMLGVSVLLVLLLADGALGRIEGVLFLSLFGPYLWLLLSGTERGQVESEFVAEYAKARLPWWQATAGVAAGSLLIVAGAYVLVEGAVQIARSLGVPERVIGLTMVAFGTSLPELAATLVAAIKRESDIALGNLIGSNVFNVIGILGITSLVKPIRIDIAASWFDLGVMLGISLLALLLFRSGQRLGRSEGGLLLVCYLAYVTYLYS